LAKIIASKETVRMTAPTTDKAQVEIAASPEAVYALIADVTRMGEWSPECHTCVWKDGTPGTVGSTFKGSNKNGLLRWSTIAKVIAADPGKEFAFATQAGDRESTVWRYRLEPTATGTMLTESYEAVYVPKYIEIAERFILRGRPEQLKKGMQATIERIKAVAESA
jgi:uncharacterized protein YndB with AHSA1/START domain